MNNVTLVGKITQDIEKKKLNSGTSLVTFTVAVERDYKDANGNKPIDYIPVEAFSYVADYLGNYGKKGDIVSIVGNIKVDIYKDKNFIERKNIKVKIESAKLLMNANNVNRDNTKRANNHINWNNIDWDNID